MQNLGTPLVSVITATYNMGHYLRETVDSILAQTHDRLELIIVDDGSTDDTWKVLEEYAADPRVKIVRQANAGQTAAKNRGLREASGQFVGFCDADDRWLPEKLARQLPHFENAPSLGVVYTDFTCIDGEGRPTPAPRMECFSGRITSQLLVDNFVNFPSALARREAIEKVGGFDTSLSMSIDYNLWLRISVDWDFRYLPETLVEYRLWEGQMSHRTGERLDNAFRMMTRFLAEHPGCVSPAARRYAWTHSYVTRGRWHAREGRNMAAAADFTQAALLRPWDLRLWKSMTKCVLRRS
ncbi:MAG: glycosyltransferase [bacterium]|nr:glycosyltransferase [bacterium]